MIGLLDQSEAGRVFVHADEIVAGLVFAEELLGLLAILAPGGLVQMDSGFGQAGPPLVRPIAGRLAGLVEPAGSRQRTLTPPDRLVQILLLTIDRGRSLRAPALWLLGQLYETLIKPSPNLNPPRDGS